MKYSTVHKALIIPVEDLERAAASLRYAIKAHRKSHNLPLTRFKHQGPVNDIYMVESVLLDAAKSVGLELGAARVGDLDVSDAG
jgi:hypothetical protein